MPDARHPVEDAPQRSGAQPVRAGSGLRAGQSGQRPQPAADDYHG